MMPIGLTISGHMHQLGVVAPVMESPHQPLDQHLPACQDTVEGDGFGNGTIVEEQGDLTA